MRQRHMRAGKREGEGDEAEAAAAPLISARQNWICDTERSPFQKYTTELSQVRRITSKDRSVRKNTIPSKSDTNGGNFDFAGRFYPCQLTLAGWPYLLRLTHPGRSSPS